ncbi:Stealth CR1 domain-containing protein [uncultured Fibrobacter sp.]|uniref:Stealth CR1 domain-containing protein n=1 Tax=uncultured Fibrobacter sp. TaxID=261512 RepID=UPI0025E0D7F7|nr:Stealth CR1 domain-containing protein [uncultured Fibrobacter sp.]
MENIDFVVLWVDGADKKWQEEKAKYQYLATGKKVDVSANRYRDWGVMPYWFRAIEKCAPWVRKVHFVTCGQKPEWLNTDCPKLNCVNHSDYIPAENLPVFNSHPIEIGMHKIEGLSDKFVYFNDDTFLLRPVDPSFFFRNGLPVQYAALHPIVPQGQLANSIVTHVTANAVTIINRHFDSRKQIRENWKKWFMPNKVGLKTALLNFLYSRHSAFIGFGNAHLPVPMLKSTIEEVWKNEPEILGETRKSRFRAITDVSQYVFRYWGLASGNFYPTSLKKLGRKFNLGVDTSVFRAIENRSHNMICLQDDEEFASEDVFNQVKARLIKAFETAFPEKSSFEK